VLIVGEGQQRTCQGWTRRAVLRVGGIQAVGLSLAGFLQARAAERTLASPRAAGCIFIWLNGGPSQFETFDPKPVAPDNIRGPYGSIATAVPGVRLCELLPQTAARADRFAVLRSLTHSDANHSSVAMLAGFERGATSIGAVATRFGPPSEAMPGYVHIGSRKGNGTVEDSNIDHVGGGDLGPGYEPMVLRDPRTRQVELPELTLSADLSADRLTSRVDLLNGIDRLRRGVEQGRSLDSMQHHFRQAVELLTSERVRTAFDLGREPEALRMRYGANFFGQSCLMARRLIEAGTRFVQVKWYDAIAFDAWDVHGAELPGMLRMEQQLCPRFDQGFSALLDDLFDRGLLNSTLVVVAGEFGRTPQLNRFGARDHWPHCFSAVLAGGGLPGGAAVGSSDSQGAFPATRPIRTEEFAATIYRSLGLDVLRDPRIRPYTKDALPIAELV
jgi:hypothetical protein